MGSKRHVFFLLICLYLVLSGCSKTERTEENSGSVFTPPLSKPPAKDVKDETPKIVISPIDKMIGEMTLDEKIGQLMMIGVEGKKFSSDMGNMIRNYHVGGVILLGKNVSATQEMLTLLNEIKKSNGENKIPLFLSVDEEGGRVSRLPTGIRKLPTNAQIGKMDDTSFSYQAGSYLAEVLNELGYNMNFAPVLDVNSNPKNPVIGDRSFGENSELVTKLGVATMNGMKENGVISVVKHFPGHGDTALDTHKSLATVNVSMERLRTLELVPFKQAIDKGVDAVMVAHILFPALDAELPSSMSKAVITGLLRDEMEFDGVVITDDLTMGAIVNEYTVADAAVQSFVAGSDLLLVVGDYENEIKTIEALKNAVKSGIITEERVNESVKRILILKDKYDINDSVRDVFDMEKINQSYNRLMAR